MKLLTLTKSSAYLIHPSSGGAGGRPSFIMKIDWKEILKIVIAVLTAIASTLGVMSCVG